MTNELSAGKPYPPKAYTRLDALQAGMPLQRGGLHAALEDKVIRQHQRAEHQQAAQRWGRVKQSLPVLEAIGVGTLGAAGIFAAYHGGHRWLTFRRLQSQIKKDIPNLLRHMEMQAAGDALKIRYEDIPESFRELRSFRLDINAVYDDSGAIDPEELNRVWEQWVPFLGTLFNGFPAKNKWKLFNYHLSPEFWLKDLTSPNAMWMQKDCVTGNTPAVKMAQQLAQLISRTSDADFMRNIESTRRQSGELKKSILSWESLVNPLSVPTKLNQAVKLDMVAYFGPRMKQGLLDLQDNAPPSQNMAEIADKIKPYFKAHYPHLDASGDKFELVAAASVGHLVKHKDVPDRVFKVIRPVADEEWFAWGRALYGVLTTLPSPLIEAVLSNPEFGSTPETKRLIERLLSLSESDDFCVAAYQLTLQMIRNFKREADTKLEAETTKKFYDLYHKPEKNMHIPKIYGYDDQVIEMQLLKGLKGIGDKPKWLVSSIYNYLSEAYSKPITHADLHNGQVRLDKNDKLFLVDYGAAIDTDAKTFANIADSRLLAHLHNWYIMNQGSVPDTVPSVRTALQKVAVGALNVRKERQLIYESTRLDKNNLSVFGPNLLKGEGEGFNQWNIFYGGNKLNNFTALLSAQRWELLKEAGISEEQAQKMPLREKYRRMQQVAKAKGLDIITMQQVKQDINRNIAELEAAKNSWITLQPAQRDKIRESLMNEYLLTFGPFIKGTKFDALKPRIVEDVSFRKMAEEKVKKGSATS